MRLIFVLPLIFLAACSSGTGNNAQPDTDEIFADIMVRPIEGKPAIEITFYRDIAEVVNGKINKGFGKNVIAVDDPKFNDIPMTSARNISGEPVYRTDLTSTKASNVVSVTSNGKTFEGKTLLESKMLNKLTKISLSPVQKAGP